MRQSTYLNVILTVNAVLLSGVLWTQLIGVAPDNAAFAQSTPPGAGIPNAADQRQRMIESLREVKASVDAMRKVMESGKIKVEVTNVEALKSSQVN